MATNISYTNLGTSKKSFTRIEVCVTNEVAAILKKEATRQSCSRKNYLETLLTNKAVSLKEKK